MCKDKLIQAASMSTSSDKSEPLIVKSDASIESSSASKKRKHTEIAEKVDTPFKKKIMDVLEKYENYIKSGKKYTSILDLALELRSEIERIENESDK